MSICVAIESLRKELPAHVRLIAVSKLKGVDMIREAFDCGQRAFGENYVQELHEKHSQLPSEIEWHFIGHLQSNKVKYIAPFVSWIHGVDSIRLLSEINKQALKHQRKIACLLQMHLGEETSKHGFPLHEAHAVAEHILAMSLEGVQICGLMGMGSFSDDVRVTEKEFTELADTFHQLKTKYFHQHKHFKEISMGMSGDYPIAVSKGSTMVRIGSNIFGHR
jgi:pyridoxal phosphate enzyme (YggS family)